MLLEHWCYIMPLQRGVRAETTAGILLLLGAGLISSVIVVIDEVPDLFRPTHGLTVEFQDASGLVKGSDVDLSGALIGKVMTDPQPVPATQQVAVKVKINESVKIRKNCPLHYRELRDPPGRVGAV